MPDNLEFPCRQCGAKLSFAPGSDELKCGYCGYTEAVPTEPSAVVEHGFEDYKPDSKGWGTELKRYDCEQCGARTEVAPHVTAYECAFCDSNQVVPQTSSVALHKPESLVPFVVDQKQAVEEFKKWVKGLWFRPNALKKQARPDRVNGVYLPFWTYDAYTASWWTADAGYYYYVEDDEGNKQRKVRWEPASGTHHEFFDDVLIQGSPTVEAAMVRQIEPWDTGKLVPYKPEYLSGHAAEDYREDMLDCWPRGKGRMEDAIERACANKVPGDTQRNLSVTTSFSNKTYKLCMLPIWISSYRYQQKPFRYIVNGQTGEVAGEAPYSWVKITLFVLTIAAIIAGLVMSNQ